MCTVPAFRALRNNFPNAVIKLIGLPQAELFAVRFANYFDGFISFPGFPGLPEQSFKAKQIADFIIKMQKEKFDLVLQMHGDGSIVNPLIEILKAKNTAGFYIPGSYRPNKNYFIYLNGVSEVKKYLRLIELLGLKTDGSYLEFPVSQKEKLEFEILRDKYKLNNYLVIHPGSRSKERRWSKYGFATIADFYADKGFLVVFTGNKEDRLIVKDISKLMENRAIDLTGKTDLGMLAEIIRNSKLLITNDTGASHIAAAVSALSLVLSVNSDAVRWAPLNKALHKVIDWKTTRNLTNIFAIVDLMLSKKRVQRQLVNHLFG